MAVADDLRAARDLVARPGGWCQGCAARNDGGDGVSAMSGEARSFSAWGAIGRAVAPTLQRPPQTQRYWAAYGALRRALPRGLFAWHDLLPRTQAEVVAAFDRAIELADRSIGEAGGDLSHPTSRQSTQPRHLTL